MFNSLNVHVTLKIGLYICSWSKDNGCTTICGAVNSVHGDTIGKWVFYSHLHVYYSVVTYTWVQLQWEKEAGGGGGLSQGPSLKSDLSSLFLRKKDFDVNPTYLYKFRVFFFIVVYIVSQYIHSVVNEHIHELSWSEEKEGCHLGSSLKSDLFFTFLRNIY